MVPDVAARLPGRGLWLTPCRDIVDRAAAKRLFARAARRSVTVPSDIADRVEALLARRCGEVLGLARRAGLAVGGFDRVADAVARGRAALLLFALDGAEPARGRLGAAGRGLRLISALTAAELGAAFGRDHIVHAAVGRSPLCDRLAVDLARLAGFRAGAMAGAAVKNGAIGHRAGEFAPAEPARNDESGSGAHD